MDCLEYLARVESGARTYAAAFPHLFVSGAGIRLRDAQGNEFIDCLANAGALPLGHNHPEVRDAVLRFVSSNQVQQALDLATPAKCEFITELFSHLPGGLREDAKIQFCSPSGSDAVEAAMKLTRFHARRSTILAFHGAYHGMTAGALAAMGNSMPRSDGGIDARGVHFAPYPYAFRCPFGTDGSGTDELSLNYLRTMLSDSHSGISKPAAVILEVVQGEGGCIPASESWLRGVRQLTLELDIPLIVDEVQTGLGRTGTLFAFERAGILPDVLVLSKAIGGGYPLAVVVYRRRLDVWPPGMHAGTFRGNQIAMVAGLITMRVIDRDGLARNAERMGALLSEGLARVAARFDSLGQVRGRGLMVGVEVIESGIGVKRRTADGQRAKAIRLNCLRNGLIVETGGRDGAVLRFLPPLIVTDSDIGAIVDRFEQAVAAAHR